MLSQTQLVENVMTDIRQLSSQQRLLVIKFTCESLWEDSQPPTTSPTLLPYGKYRGEKTTDWEDFALAEWHPTLEEEKGN
jgi:hypothetical protein